MAKILCLETSTEICSVCIHEDAELLALKESSEGFVHSKKLTLFVQDCLEDSSLTLKDIDAVCLSSGPGSYTGLRVGAATAKAFCFALDIPLIAINTLQAMSTGFISGNEALLPARIVPMIDARREEVYAAVYDHLGNIMIDTFSYILDKHEFPLSIEMDHNYIILGNGASKAMKHLKYPSFSFYLSKCSAQDLIPESFAKFNQGEFTSILDFAPSYFKAPNITTPKKQPF